MLANRVAWREDRRLGGCNAKGECFMGPWWSIAKAFFQKLSEDKVSVLAAAVAFYAIVSVFPALSALVSLYGLVADPNVVRTQLDALQGVMPAEALSLLSGWLDSLLESRRSSFGLGLLVSLAISLWIARNATGTMMVALNVTFDEAEERGIVRYNITALLLTALLILLGVIGVVLVAVLPALTGLLPLPPTIESAISLVRWPILAALIVIAITVIYHFGPTRSDPRWGWSSAGAMFATLLWIAGSVLFSIYVGRFASYDKTYGSIGAVVVLMLWFWLGAYAVLAGSELNAVIRRELKAAGPPAPGRQQQRNDD
jgi:membrane protein